MPERLYKRAAKAHESDDLGGAFVLTLDTQAPTLEEVTAVQVEVNGDALAKEIGAVKVTVRTSGWLQVDSKMAQANKAAE